MPYLNLRQFFFDIEGSPLWISKTFPNQQRGPFYVKENFVWSQILMKLKIGEIIFFFENPNPKGGPTGDPTASSILTPQQL